MSKNTKHRKEDITDLVHFSREFYQQSQHINNYMNITEYLTYINE